MAATLIPRIERKRAQLRSIRYYAWKCFHDGPLTSTVAAAKDKVLKCVLKVLIYEVLRKDIYTVESAYKVFVKFEKLCDSPNRDLDW